MSTYIQIFLIVNTAILHDPQLVESITGDLEYRRLVDMEGQLSVSTVQRVGTPNPSVVEGSTVSTALNSLQHMANSSFPFRTF